MTGQHHGPQRTATANRPIVGVFDSGVGGLSVVSALRRLTPEIPVHYLADAACAPYGPRSPEAIRSRSHAITRLLTQRGSAALVIACNTATAAAADVLRAQWSLPIIGMEPAIKPAVLATRTGTVAVLATDGTLASQRFAGLLARYTGDTRVLVEPCGDLVAHAEAGQWDGATVDQAIHRHLENVIAEGADTVVLGCTHFPLLRSRLDAIAAGRIHFVDTGEAVARQILARTGIPPSQAENAAPGPLQLLTTGDPYHLTRIAQRLFTAATAAERVDLASRHN